MNSVLILRTLQHINTWAVLPGLMYLAYLASIEYYLYSVFAVLLISKVGASIGQHRYFTHRSFKMKPWKEKIVAILATLSTTGTTLQYVTVHRYHHLNSDRGKDLHSPHEIGYWRSFWHWYKDDPKEVVPLNMIKDLLKNTFLIKLHKYYLLVILLYILILAAIDINLVLFCYMIPAGFAWWSSAVLSLPLHLSSQGYRNFDTDDETVNSHLWNCLTLGEGLHNNHHAKPNEYNFAFTEKAWEWDLSSKIIDIFLKCKT